MWRALSCLLLAATVGGCGFAGVDGRGVGSAQGPMGHQVQPGDSIQSIATRYGTTVEAVAAQNGIQQPYYINVGQRLVIPQPDTYVVRQGDTINDIARVHGVSPAELARINGIAAPYPVQVGQTLRFPQSTAQGSVPIGTAPSSPVQTAALPPPDAGGVPVVGAAVPGAPIVAPSAVPGSATGAPLPLVGAPQIGAPQVGAPQADPTPGQGVTQPVPAPQFDTAALPPAGAASDLPPAPQVDVPAAPATPSVGTGGLPALSGSGFMRPVDGSVLTRFGEGSPVPNDGINIAAPAGTPILAAEAGVVAYVGQNIDVFGNLVLVRHADGWVTAYGHAEAILVGEGDTVTRGQVIGRVGHTGSVTVPQLHFELRRGTEPVDPQAYLEG